MVALGVFGGMLGTIVVLDCGILDMKYITFHKAAPKQAPTRPDPGVFYKAPSNL